MRIIDTRERRQFSAGHITGAYNIPFDELYTRIPNEVPVGAKTIVDCHYVTRCEAQAKNGGTVTVCDMVKEIFKMHGYKDLKFIGDDISTLEQAGVPISRDLLERRALTEQ